MYINICIIQVDFKKMITKLLIFCQQPLIVLDAFCLFHLLGSLGGIIVIMLFSDISLDRLEPFFFQIR